MHKLLEKPFEFGDFSWDNQLGENNPLESKAIDYIAKITRMCNDLRRDALDGDKGAWRLLVQLLPVSYNQKRTCTLNYAVLRNIVIQRRNHKLTEWREFIEQIKELPYAKELIFYNLED